MTIMTQPTHVNIKRTRLVIKSKRRFITFLICAITLIYILIAGFAMPNIGRADLAVAPKSIIVCSGDTLWSIANTHAGKNGDIRSTIDKIKMYNQLESSTLQVGQTLLIPAE